MLNKPSTFYCFSVVGIDETFADLLDIHRDKMSRKEFCWLTGKHVECCGVFYVEYGIVLPTPVHCFADILLVDPLPPSLVKRTDTAISLAWDLVDFCGVDVAVVEDSMEYVLEGCVGQPWTPGIASKFVSDIANPEYKVLARGNQLSEVVVNDLQPAQWYHFRLNVRYNGTWVASESKPFATLCSRPSRPKQPSVYLILNGNDMFLDRNRVDPQIRLCWGPPKKNGTEINKYQVQVREYFDEVTKETVQEAEESEVFEGNEEVDDDMSNVRADENGNRMVGDKWHTVYCNLISQVVLQQPSKTCVGWACRLRAQNAHGWSDFSEPLVLDCDTHPKLFPPNEPVSPRLLPPLDSSRLGSSRLDSSRHNSSRLDSSRRECSRRDSSERSARRDSAGFTYSKSTNELNRSSSSESKSPNLLLPRGSPVFRYGELFVVAVILT